MQFILIKKSAGHYECCIRSMRVMLMEKGIDVCGSTNACSERERPLGKMVFDFLSRSLNALIDYAQAENSGRERERERGGGGGRAGGIYRAWSPPPPTATGAKATAPLPPPPPPPPALTFRLLLHAGSIQAARKSDTLPSEFIFGNVKRIILMELCPTHGCLLS